MRERHWAARFVDQNTNTNKTNSEAGREIRRAVIAAQRRVRFHQFLLALAAVLIAALAFAAVVFAVRQFASFGAETLALVLAAFALACAIVLFQRTARGTGEFATARAIDERAQAADRLASATEFLSLDPRAPILDAQIRDADHAAAGLTVAPLFPFAARTFFRRLGIALLVVPLVWVALYVDLPSLIPHRAAQTPDQIAEEFPEQAPDVPAPALEEVTLSEEVLTLIRPAEEMIQRWKERLREIEQSREAEVEQPTEPEPTPELPAETPRVVRSQSGLLDRATRNVATDMNSQQVRLSDIQGLVDRQADGDFADAFTYLDKQVFGEKGEKLAEVQAFAEQMVDDSEKQGRTAVDLSKMSERYMQSGMENDKNAAFENEVKGSQMQSMSEFLSEYAAHLMRMTGKMQEIIDQSQKLDEQKAKEIYKERYQLVDTGQRITRPISELTEKDLEEGTIRPLSPEEAGGSQAGYGFGTPDGQFKVPKVEKEASLYAELDSQFGEGKSLAILEELAAGNPAGYEALFTHYAMSAEEILNAEDIPAVIKNYVRAYFLAISPAHVDE